ncbi:putative short-chain type dehydrogenase [Emericellopsis atlantica]|uniref:Short-chain type dehydrogenase n=1 Tax=Emericellopsis atlantica TaxID=2614577 RepID=A0A9P8CPF7_9HYPO|nr:putative short-chain type dehydrogenase [Emericellopsis atlantica]KAG9254819.1 putative short-chain type dehydrogenase [Emericellopsis atlantica]
MNLPPRPSRSLAGKVAIVTGAGSSPTGLGNGRAISILLAEDQCSVVCVDLSLESAQTTVELCLGEGKGGRAVAVQADVTKEDDCRRIVETAMSELGRVDILINNVGILGPAGSAVEVEREEWARGLDINVTSMMLMSKHTIPKMLLNAPTSPSELSIRGSIVNMASVAGLLGGTPSLLYPVSKGAVVQLTRAMASHHGKDGIRVNTVCPGMIYTPMVSDGGMSEETRQRRRERSLLQTEGSAWDAAGAVRYLAGGEARWVTGTVLTVDAGATCTTKF